ncbi:dCMP deaminase [Pseudooceanicola sp. GBMRC 2024]|uniref:dCMP deaminase n=1 Tax=Pseudooceanicola albus TaxID=2692189 RepID=A0A6L7G1A4_9RHOB|nr:deaminase [Pseudooceanicola albus]MXN17719.1 dCMP deaminase [Pseudooceanicola albus]
MTDDSEWHGRFMAICDLLAGFSEDRDRQVGAVIVGSGHVIRATGWNGLPRGIAADDDRLDRASGRKFHWVEHAERNAIFNAARIGVSLEGCTLYTNVFPCADCARALIQAGITELCAPCPPARDSKLGESFAISARMLAEAGVDHVVTVSRHPAPEI